MVYSKSQLVHWATVAKAVCALNPLQMWSKTTSTWCKLKSCTNLPFITSISVTLDTHSPPLANIVLHTQYLKHLLSYECRFREAALKLFKWKFEQAMQNKTLSALGSFQLQHKPDAIFTSCMNDGTARRTTSPVITPKCWLPLKREECQLLHQKPTLLAAQDFPLAFSHLRTDQAWTCTTSQKLAESQPVAVCQHAN